MKRSNTIRPTSRGLDIQPMCLENTQLVCQRHGVVRQGRGFVSRDQGSFLTRATPTVVRVACLQYYLSKTKKKHFIQAGCKLCTPTQTNGNFAFVFLSKARCEIVELAASKSETLTSAYHLNPQINHHPCFDQLGVRRAWYC